MPFCPQCGQSVTDDVRFCPSCGTQVSQSQPDAHPIAATPQQSVPIVNSNVSTKLQYSKMQPEELLPHLYEAERAINAGYPYIQQDLELDEQKEGLGRIAASHKSRKIAFMILTFICAALLAVLCVIVIAPTDNVDIITELFLTLIKAISPPLFFTLIIFTVICLIVWLVSKKSVSKTLASIQELEQQSDALAVQFNQAHDQHLKGYTIAELICPEECLNPQYMRQFIGYIESGRAGSLREATDLFEQYMHRERMENLAYAQVQASLAAEQAAYAAMEASQRAAQEARNATDAANRATWASIIK